MSFQVIVPLEDLRDLIAAAERVPALEDELRKLQRQYDGLRIMYSEILEALRR